MHVRRRVERQKAEREQEATVTLPHVRRRRVASADTLHDGGIVEVFEGDDTPVIDMLRRAPHPPDAFRKGEYIHVSDLIGKCLRSIALSREHELPMPARGVSHSMGLTFAQGTAIHDYVKGRFVERHKDSLYGKWACLCGKTITKECTGDKIPEDKCGHCGTAPYRYEEVVIQNDTLMLRGSPDISMYMRKQKCLHPVEIKSMAHDEWKSIVRPKPDHLIQVLCYWYLMREAGYKMSTTVSVLYVTKGFVFKGTPYKEFLVDAQASLHYLDDYLDDAKALVAHTEGGVLPARVACAAINSPQAKKCHVVKECFDHD